MNPPDPALIQYVIIGCLVNGLGTLASLAVSIITIVRAGKPQQRDVKIQSDVVAKEDYDKHVSDNKREHENLFSKIGGVERGANARLDETFRTIRAEIREDLKELTGELNDRTDKLHDRLSTLSKDLVASISELKGKWEGTQ